MSTIRFYRVDDPYGEFSNFSRHRIHLKGKPWPTTEHYFQAQKFAGTPHEEAVRQQKGPSMAAQMGRDRALPLRKDWESVKDNVMRDAIYAKFTQHVDLKELLLSTGDALLIEHTTKDRYWGDGGDGTGKNRLGHILMEVRRRIREENIPPTESSPPAEE
ncbi:NADAR family protein [Myxococcota bacterium]|nr:NADAR family protein [Myxococcota bacterium]